MKRREVILLIGGAAVAVPLALPRHRRPSRVLHKAHYRNNVHLQ